jgi:hypothetical protein
LLLEKCKKNYRSIFCTVFATIAFLVSSYFLGSFNHFDPWTGAKLYPSFATLNFTDLYNQIKAPFILTVYGPCASFFYLPATLGNDPESCMWIALSLNILTLVFFSFAVFILIPKKLSAIYLFGAISFLFCITLDKTTKSLFQIHYDLPTLFFFFPFFLLLKNTKRPNLTLFLCLCFLWLAVWTKITALPWLFLPFMLKLLHSNNGSLINVISANKILIYQSLSGILILLIFGFSYGFNDLYFHLIEATNVYPWRECSSLFGSNQEMVLNHDISSKLISLLYLTFYYLKEYWWMFFSCLGILIYQLSTRDGTVLTWLSLSYLMVLPTCLSALAKFGGVENSLVFAHFFGLLTIFLQSTLLIDKYISIPLSKEIIMGLSLVIFSIISLRSSITCLRDTSNSPQQLAYEYSVSNPQTPVFFPMAPHINYLANKEIYDSGEALTYSTMMSQDSLPQNAGLDFMQNTNLIAFGNPPYSRSYFDRKLNLTKIMSPDGLENWNIYEATLKK